MTPVGERLGDVRRRRGLTQEQLAEAAGISVSCVSKLEQGTRSTARVVTFHALARALDVETSELFSTAPLEPVTDEQDLNLLPLRRALAPAPTGLRPGWGEQQPAGVQARTDAAWRLYHGNQYAAVADELPQVLAQVRATGSTSTLCSALRLAGHLLIQMNQTDLAYPPIAEGIEHAETMGDMISAGNLVNSLGWLFMRQGRLDDTETVSVTMADRVEPKLSEASEQQLCTWGWLLLRGSAAAARNNRPGEADDMLSLASAAARRTGKTATFGPNVVRMKRVENAVIVGNPRRALRIAQSVPANAGVFSSDTNRFRLDMAAALWRSVTTSQGSTFYGAFAVRLPSGCNTSATPDRPCVRSWTGAPARQATICES